jgi:hypothetical protein
MKVSFEKHIKHPDLTRTASASRSVGAKLEALIRDCVHYDLNRLKREFVNIIDSEETVISKLKVREYKDHMNRIYTADRMRTFLANIYLASANLSTKLK